MAEIILIVARSKNHVIGRDNAMPWQLPTDLKHFKNTTTGHPIIMGRNTYESIGKALPARANHVISRQTGYRLPDAQTHTTLNDALTHCANAEKIFIIGGGKLYQTALPFANTLIITEIDTIIENGDTYFTFDEQHWQITNEEYPPKADKDDYAIKILTYTKKIPSLNAHHTHPT